MIAVEASPTCTGGTPAEAVVASPNASAVPKKIVLIIIGVSPLVQANSEIDTCDPSVRRAKCNQPALLGQSQPRPRRCATSSTEVQKMLAA
jgi:hypothetical protein